MYLFLESCSQKVMQGYTQQSSECREDETGINLQPPSFPAKYHPSPREPYAFPQIYNIHLTFFPLRIRSTPSSVIDHRELSPRTPTANVSSKVHSCAQSCVCVPGRIAVPRAKS